MRVLIRKSARRTTIADPDQQDLYSETRPALPRRVFPVPRTRLGDRLGDQEDAMAFTVTSDEADGTMAENFLKPAEAYRRARECEARGQAVKIRLASGDEVTAEEFRELYLLKDLD
ncbi:hypothetical protein [Methylobacterium oxalidis]|uniref:hypothetical protein n=1 Tax=Methylobacterium oxalidis TaxID=944322 RepID=UPI003314B8EF